MDEIDWLQNEISYLVGYATCAIQTKYLSTGKDYLAKDEIAKFREDHKIRMGPYFREIKQVK